MPKMPVSLKSQSLQMLLCRNERKRRMKKLTKILCGIIAVAVTGSALYFVPLFLHYQKGMEYYRAQEYERACETFRTCNYLLDSYEMAEKCRKEFLESMICLKEDGTLREDDLWYFVEEAAQMDPEEIGRSFTVPINGDGPIYRSLAGENRPLLGLHVMHNVHEDISDHSLSCHCDNPEKPNEIIYGFHSHLVSEEMAQFYLKQLRALYGKEFYHNVYESTSRWGKKTTGQLHEYVFNHVTFRYSLPPKNSVNYFTEMLLHFPVNMFRYPEETETVFYREGWGSIHLVYREDY